MDFYRIKARETKNETLEVYPDFSIAQSRDLMIRGGVPYAIWDEERGLWSQDQYDIIRMVDEDVYREAQDLRAKTTLPVVMKAMREDSSRTWKKFLEFAKTCPDSYHQLNNKVIFANDEVKKSDYASKRVPYALEEGSISAWDELVSTLYLPEERAKIEWTIGSIVAGDSKKIQKFLVFYGSAGTGKSTMINIIEKLFEGYTHPFEGKALGSSSGTFATEAFKDNPLVAFEHDSDLSRLEDNTRFNSIIAHEEMTMNEKYKAKYKARLNATLILGSNQPVKISDAKSGMLRRLIDVHPTGVRFPEDHYDALMARIDFELGAIAYHCLQTYRSMGKNYYNAYRPQEMQLQTDPFFNFIEDHFDLFKSQDHTTLNQAWALYKEWCEETGIEKQRLYKHKMREELRNYFLDFSPKKYIDGAQVRSVYSGFVSDKFRAPKETNGKTFSLVLDETESLFDEVMMDQPAQLATTDGTPRKVWRNVRTKLSALDTSELHFVKVPDDHIVIDFDLQDSKEATALERNLAAASEWPPTYAEISKSGSGIHLHYRYTHPDGVGDLASSHSEHVEVKTFNGDASLRRRLSRCNAVPIASISSGLPLKAKKETMLQTKTITTERGLRELINRNLRKEIHPGTKPSIDFIKKILDDAYESGMKYDVTDMRTKILAFANNSTNQSALAVKAVREMKWQSEDGDELPADQGVEVADDRLVFFDVEVYKNLFVVCWKFQGAKEVVRMVNPRPHEVEELFKLKLVGFYNRRYDNHILYAASMGAPPEELFRLSSKLVEGNRSATYGAAYNLSYADIWDFSSEKMGLKKFEVKLGILHMELDLPWDQPVEEKKWNQVVEYCANDVIATEAVFEDRKGDFIARQILAELSGLTVNDTTQTHAAKILFGDDRHPQKKFVYTDLSKEFPGYKFELGKSSYKGEDPGEGGYVYAEPGVYEQVAVLDIASMHPASIIRLNLFGDYTRRFATLKDARVAIKRQDYERARELLGSTIGQLLDGAEADPGTGEALAYALKIVINTVYGLTSAKFENPFRDMRNVDNIVAKRGALFMIDLKESLQKAGVEVIHIKTDSVKIPNATSQIIADVKTLGSMYGYDFEHEGTYDKFVLVNDAVFVGGKARVPWDNEFPGYDWSAVGAQFQHPYVFKSLFSGEELSFDDYCEARSVMKGTMYLCDPNTEEVVEVRHVGRTGQFVPVLKDGYRLYRKNEDKYYSVSGTKNHLWMEAHLARELGDKLKIDLSYFDKLKDDAIKAIEKFGSFEEFVERK